MVKRQRGATLVELMIALAIGMVSVLGVASLVGMGIGVNTKLLTNSRLNEELKNVVGLIARDLRRAGYNGDSVNMVSDPDTFPSEFANSVAVSEFSGEDLNSCITYAYDADQDGSLDTGADNENFGFRLRDEAIEIRKSGAACTADGWEDLTDSDILTVTGLNFTLTTATINDVISTEVTITATASLVSNANFSRSYSTTILVRSYD